MGTSAIISVLALILFFSIMNGSFNTMEKKSTDNTAGYVKYSTARDIAFSAINLALKNKELYGTFPVSGTVDGGSYSVTGIQSGGVVNLTSTAVYADSSYQIKVKFDVYPKPFPGVGAAIGFNVDSLNFNINNNNHFVQIDGHNYDSTGQNPVGYGDVAGVAVLTAMDSSEVSPFGSKIDGSTDVTVDPTLANPADFVNEYIANADYVFPASASITGNQVLGSATEPKITYVAGNPDTTKAVQFGGTVLGWGILIIQGSVAFKGTFEWHGLVIINGTSDLDLNVSSGSPKIYGSILMGGAAGSSINIKGTPEFRYSSQTLDKAKYVGKLLAYHIVDWYE